MKAILALLFVLSVVLVGCVRDFQEAPCAFAGGGCWSVRCSYKIDCGPGCYCAQNDWCRPPLCDGVCVKGR